MMLGSVLLLLVAGVSAQRRPPNYSVSDMPETEFDCRDRTIGGYYADPETECQMFHVCVKVPGIGVQDFRFLCPNDTAFDQEHQICDDWYNIDCESETLYLSSKFDLYRIGSEQTSSSPRPPAPKKAAPIPLGPSTPRGLPDVPRPNPRPVNSNAVGRHDDDELQRADTGDRRLHSQRGGDIFRGSSSGNFFNSKNGGKDDDDDYEPDSRYNAFQRQQKPSQTTTTTSAPFNNYQQQRKKKVVVHRKPIGQSSAEVTQPPFQAQPQRDNDEEVEDAYYHTYQDDQRSNIDSANQAFGQRGNFPATRTTAEPYYHQPSSTQEPTQPPTAAQQPRARYNTIQRAQPTTEQPQSPSTQKAYSLFYQPKNINNYQSTQAPSSQQYNNNRQPVNPSTTQAPSSQQYNNYRQPVNPSTTQAPNPQQYNNYRQPVNPPTTQAPSSQQYNNYRQPVNPSTTQAPSSQQYNNYRQPVNPSTTQAPSPQQYNNYRQPINPSTTQSTNNYYNKQASPSSSTDNYYNNNNNNYYKQSSTTTSSTTQAPFKYNNNNYYKQPVTTTTTQAPNNYYNNANNNANNNNYNANYNNNNYYRQQSTSSSTQAPNYYTTTQAPSNYNYYTTTTTQAPYYNQYKQPASTTNNYYQRTPSTQAPAYNANYNNNNANNYNNNNNANYNNNNSANYYNNQNRFNNNSGENSSSSSEEYEKVEEQEFLKTAPSSNYKPSDFNVYNRNYNKEAAVESTPKPAPFSQTPTTEAPRQKFYSAAPSSPAPQPTKSNYYDQPRPFSSASPSTTTTKDYYQNYQTSPTPARKYTAKVIPSNASPVAKTSAEQTPPAPEKAPKKNDYAYEYYDDDVGVYEYGEDPISDAHFSKIKTKLNKVKPTN